MSCREKKLSSALLSYGTILAGFHDRQGQGVLHRLMDEGEGTPDPTPDQVDAFIDEWVARVQADPTFSAKRRLSFVERLDEARGQDIPGNIMYALPRFPERAQLARTALNQYLDRVARDMGLSRAEVSAAAGGFFEDAIEGGRGVRAPEAFCEEFLARPEALHLPSDRASKWSWYQLEKRRAAAVALQPVRPVVQRVAVESGEFASLGYSREHERLEVEFRSRPGRVYAYRLPEDVHTQFQAAADPDAFYHAHIRGNPDYVYPTVEAAHAAGVLRRCATCGEFAGVDLHTCPVRGSTEEWSRTVRAARAALLGSPDELPEARSLPVPASWTRYPNDLGSVSTVSLWAAKAEARREDIAFPVRGVAVDADGTQSHVTGFLHAHYEGRGMGYTVSAVTYPGDSGERQLRCTCPQYAATYTCPHVRGVVADIANRMNAPTVTTPQDVDAARHTAPDDLTPGSNAAVAWGEPESAWAENPDMLAHVIADTQALRKAGRNPVPFLTDDATGGMGVQGTGRAVGIEIEFDLPESMSPEEKAAALAGIGRALYRMELTATRVQEPYGVEEVRGYATEHTRGWVFKEDLSCAGEVSSPIMWDTKEAWTNVERVCDTIRRYGGVVSENTGLHVHVSAGDFGSSGETHSRLIELVHDHEDVLYRLGTDPERGVHRGSAFCRRNTTPAPGYVTAVDVLSEQRTDRDVAVNFTSVQGGNATDHVEFRPWDGSLDPAVIQARAKLSLALTQAAVRGVPRDAAAAASLGEHVKRQQQAGPGQVSWVEESAGLRALLDQVFWRDVDKRQVAALYAITEWQERQERNDTADGRRDAA